ncbi:cyanophycinase [bacterium]|nr:cyanophycinase [bacterium]
MKEKEAPTGFHGVNLILLLTIFCSILLFPFHAKAVQAPLVLIGGGKEDFMPKSWSESTFKFIVEKANHGKILVLSCTDELDSIPSYFIHLGAESAELLKIPDRPFADDPETYKAIEKADGLFIVDREILAQINNWRGTRTESAIRNHFASGKIIGGSGTGAQILAEVKAFRKDKDLTPPEAIRSPSAIPFSFQTDFLPLIPRVLVETHFTRMGGLPIILIKIAQWKLNSPSKDFFGIGIDEKTALVIDENLNAKVLGEGTVTFVAAASSSTIRLDPRLPPIFSEVTCDVLTEGFVYNVSERRVVTVPPTAVQGAAFPGGGTYRPILIDGSNDSSATLGDFEIFNHNRDSLALQLGILDERPGEQAIWGTVIMSSGFSHQDYYENRLGEQRNFYSSSDD